MPDIAPDVAALVNHHHLEQYFGEWMVEEERFRGMVANIESMDLSEHIRAEHEKRQASGRSGKSSSTYRIEDGVAIFEVRGTMTKYGSSMSGAPSSIQLRKDILDAGRNEDVSSIAILFDSPGGTSAGTREVAAAVASVAKTKPVIAYADDLMASAAYFAASGATKIFASESALVGSIGTYMVVQDSSGAAAQKGIKVHVIKTGPFKGAGAPGAEITAEQLASFQATVDALNEPFVQSVAAGRKLTMDRARELADGRIHIASQAKALGLIDGISSFDDVLASLKTGKGKRMSDTTESTKPKAATVAELQQALPKADAEFVLGQLAKGATIEQATAAWGRVLEQKLEAKEKEVTEAKAKAEQLEKEKAEQASSGKKPGADPVLPSGKQQKQESESVGSATEQYQQAVADAMATGKFKTEAEARIHIGKTRPELRKGYAQEFTQQHPELLHQRED